MKERSGLVTSGGKPVTLVGDEVKVGDKAPDVTLAANNMAAVKLSERFGKVLIVSAVPSLDTSTCDIETRRFNTEAAGLGEDMAVITISRDLPFAQKRWCGAAGVDRVETLSDYREAAFGKSWGVLMKENGLLTRAVFVVDRDGVVRYIQIVPETGKEPDYAAVLTAARALTS